MCIVVCITLHSKSETVLNFAATITSIDEAYSGEKGGGDTKFKCAHNVQTQEVLLMAPYCMSAEEPVFP